MEEILSSIRRIIADDDGGKAAAQQAARPAAPAAPKAQPAKPHPQKLESQTPEPRKPEPAKPVSLKPAPAPDRKPEGASAPAPQESRPMPRQSEALAPAARQTQAATEKALDEIGAMVASGLTRIVSQQEAAAMPATAGPAEAIKDTAPEGASPEPATRRAPQPAAPVDAEGKPLDLTRALPGERAVAEPAPDDAVPAEPLLAEHSPDAKTQPQPGEVVFRDEAADVLELTQVVLPDGTVADTRPGRASAGLPAAVADAASTPRARVTLASAEPDPDALSAPRTEERLYRERAPRPEADEDPLAGDALERAMLRLLKPMLRQWMDENLEGIVERVVREELRRRP